MVVTNAFFGIGKAKNRLPYQLANERGKPLPKLAQLAVRQARFVTENITRNEGGQNLKDKFDYYQRGQSKEGKILERLELIAINQMRSSTDQNY